MPVEMKTELVGVQDAIKALRKIDPELRKQFNRDAKAIGKPVLDEAAQNYPQLPLSGMARKWKTILPWDLAKARRGLRVKVDTSRKTANVILLQNADKAAAMFESAGRRGETDFTRALGPLGAHGSRVLGPALERRQNDVVDGFRRLALDTINTVNRELR